MPYLVVRTEVRPLSLDDLARVWTAGGRARDELVRPERRWQTAVADDLETAWRLARAFASTGPVRAGRQRVKVVRLGEPTTETSGLSAEIRRRPSPGVRTPAPLGATPLAARLRSVPSPVPVGATRGGVLPPVPVATVPLDGSHPRESQTRSR